MKRAIAMQLCLVLGIGLLSGCGGENPAPARAENSEQQIISQEIAATETGSGDSIIYDILAGLAGELQLAYEYGLLPAEWLEDMAGSVMHSEYAALLSRVIESWDAAELEIWQECSAAAAASDEVMQREDAFLMLSYAWVQMGMSQTHIVHFSNEGHDRENEYYSGISESLMAELSWDYPLFPNWQETVYPIYNSDYMWGAVQVLPLVCSAVSGEPMFDWDENNSLRLQEDISRDAAVRALLRMVEHCNINIEKVNRLTEPVTVSPETMDAELKSAYDMGFLPEEWLEDVSAEVTVAEFNGLLTKLVALRGEEYVPQWENIAAGALQCEELCQRDDAMLSMFEAAMLLGIDEERGSDIHAGLEEKSTAEDWWHGQSRDYDYFPGWDQPFDDSGEDVFSRAVWYVVRHVTMDEHRYIFKPLEDYTLGLGMKIKREEAARALVRFAKSSPVLCSEDGNYLDITEVGGYDRSIITDAMLNAPTDLPEVSQSKLPDSWRGAGISARKTFKSEYLPFDESDIVFLDENGFNFTRLFFGFDSLRFPDYPEDGRLVNENELKALDQLLAWCIERGIHLQISSCAYLDEKGEAIRSMPTSEAQWEMISLYWQALARRYAGIDSKYLSFDLCNEIAPMPGQDELLASSTQGLKKLIEAVRAEDPNRVLLYSDASRPQGAWTETVASLGVALGCHPYFPEILSSTDWEFVEHNSYLEFNWPMPYFIRSNFTHGSAAIQISGDISGSVLSLHPYYSGAEPIVGVYADGSLLERIELSGELRDDGQYYYGDRIYSVQLPEGVETIELWVEQDYVGLDTLIIEKNGVKTTLVPSDGTHWEIFEDPLPLIVNGDGTYTNSENLFCDEDMIYETAVKPYKELADKYGVGFMINEFGVFGTETDWNIEDVSAYHDTVLKMVEKYKLGWSYCELFNIYPKHLIIYYGDESQWTGATVEDYTLTCSDGSSKTLKVCKELLDVFRAHTMK